MTTSSFTMPRPTTSSSVVEISLGRYITCGDRPIISIGADEHEAEHGDQDERRQLVLHRLRQRDVRHAPVDRVATEPAGERVVGDEQHDDARS